MQQDLNRGADGLASSNSVLRDWEEENRKQKRQILVLCDLDETHPIQNLRRDDEIFDSVEGGSSPECVRFWVNQECLVKGLTKSKKYGWFAEELASNLGVPVYQRSTGGGVVYHDLGNLNWTFYLRNPAGSFLSPPRVFSGASSFVVRGLNRLGIKAEFSAPNRIEVEHRKVSGMAARSSINTLLVHGTLLLQSNLSRLNQLCEPPPESPPVANLCEWRENLTMYEVIQATVLELEGSGFTTILPEKPVRFAS